MESWSVCVCVCSHSSPGLCHPAQPTLLSQPVYIGGAVMSLFSDGELRLRLLLKRLLCASLVLRGDKRGRSLKAAPLSGCWRRLLIGKMLIFFFDQEEDYGPYLSRVSHSKMKRLC